MSSMFGSSLYAVRRAARRRLLLSGSARTSKSMTSVARTTPCTPIAIAPIRTYSTPASCERAQRRQHFVPVHPASLPAAGRHKPDEERGGILPRCANGRRSRVPRDATRPSVTETCRGMHRSRASDCGSKLQQSGCRSDDSRASSARTAPIIQAQEPVRVLPRSSSVSSDRSCADLSVLGTTDAHIRRTSCMARIMGCFQRSHGSSRSACLRMNRTG